MPLRRDLASIIVHRPNASPPFSRIRAAQEFSCFPTRRPLSQMALPCLSSSLLKRTSEVRFGLSSWCAGRVKKIFLSPLSEIVRLA